MIWQKFTELEDLPWFPRFFRDEITDALRYFTLSMRGYDGIIPEFLWTMQQSTTKNVVDLCSGGSGPWEYLLMAITDLDDYVDTITLTDLYPNREYTRALDQKSVGIHYHKDPVDARNIDPELVGVRTLFSAFHHFTTDEATAILQDAVDKKMPVCVFEMTERRFMNLFHNLISTIILFTRLLFRRPLSPARLLFSYLIPIVPLVYLYDSTISHLRTFSTDDLRTMVGALKNTESFEWEIGSKRSPKSHIKNSYLIGYPK